MEHSIYKPETTDTDAEKITIRLVLMLTENCFGENPPGSIGLVYQLVNELDITYACILLESGDDLNLFETAHLFETFIIVGYVDFTYEYKGPFELMNDVKLGIFTQFFDEATTTWLIDDQDSY